LEFQRKKRKLGRNKKAREKKVTKMVTKLRRILKSLTQNSSCQIFILMTVEMTVASLTSLYPGADL